MNPALLLARAARLHADRPALAAGTRVIASYAEFAARVARLAGGLSQRLAPGDRVGLVMKNCPEYAEAMFACWHAGLVAVPINAKLHPRELEYILGHSGCRLCFATPELHSGVAGLTVPGMDSVVEVGGSAWDAQFTAPIEVGRRAHGRRCGLAVLYQRYHRAGPRASR
jgi:long-chain acyl-CoA synthetase